MSRFFELLLAPPLNAGWRRALLFSGFYFHMVLVLLALGTAFLAVFYILSSSLGGDSATQGWDKRILRTFMGFKSLAVVLGVAPLLLIQVGRTLPFFNATGLFAGFWMLVIGLLVVSFLSFDALGHSRHVHQLINVGVGLLALVFLAAVPAIFAAVLVAAENPGVWPDILRLGGFLPGRLVFHWLLRTVHVLGAALIFGALFHDFFTSAGDPEKRARMRRWTLAGILIELVVGPLLLVSVPLGIDTPGIVFLGLGLVALAAFTWLVARCGAASGGLKLTASAPLLLVVLLFMLLVRQNQQDRAFAPLEAAAAAGSRDRAAALAPYEKEALAKYREDVRTVYDNGPTIYGKSCAFCHGENGDGRGAEAGNLAIPPAAISEVRAARPYLHRILAAGVPGTGMPYFAVFVYGRIEGLIAYLDKRWGVVGMPQAVPGVSAADLGRAQKIYGERCASCHGPDGRPTAAAAKFAPPPPHFTDYSLSPGRTIEVFTRGYPGTIMGPFGAGLSPELQSALVQVLYDLRKR
jgi:mono/diheme cytochrome c family protein